MRLTKEKRTKTQQDFLTYNDIAMHFSNLQHRRGKIKYDGIIIFNDVYIAYTFQIFKL